MVFVLHVVNTLTNVKRQRHPEVKMLNQRSSYSRLLALDLTTGGFNEIILDGKSAFVNPAKAWALEFNPGVYKIFTFIPPDTSESAKASGT